MRASRSPAPAGRGRRGRCRQPAARRSGPGECRSVGDRHGRALLHSDRGRSRLWIDDGPERAVWRVHGAARPQDDDHVAVGRPRRVGRRGRAAASRAHGRHDSVLKRLPCTFACKSPVETTRTRPPRACAPPFFSRLAPRRLARVLRTVTPEGGRRVWLPGKAVVSGASGSTNGRVTSAVHDIWDEFQRMPDLRLTLEQAVERLGVDAADVADVLAAFVSARLLRRLDDGVYVRCTRTDG